MSKDEEYGQPVEGNGGNPPGNPPDGPQEGERTAGQPVDPADVTPVLEGAGRYQDPRTRIRARAQLRAKQREAYALYTGTSMKVEAIAARLGVRPNRVSAWVRQVEAQTIDDFRSRIFNLKFTQTAQLEHLYREALANYERTATRRKRKVTTERGVRADGPVNVRTIQHEDALGDPRFLAEARAVLADVRKIWGLDAPVKVAQTTPEGEAIAMASASLHDKLDALARSLREQATEVDPTIVLPESAGPRVN